MSRFKYYIFEKNYLKMKSLLLFGAIALSINVFGQDIKTVKIGNLEVMTQDLGNMNWGDAMKACADLGDGWRLPTKEEWIGLDENKDKIVDFEETFYWSSTEGDSNDAWVQDLGYNDGGQFVFDKSGNIEVRAVRTF